MKQIKQTTKVQNRWTWQLWKTTCTKLLTGNNYYILAWLATFLLSGSGSGRMHIHYPILSGSGRIVKFTIQYIPIIDLFSLALTIEALQGKMCRDSLPSGGGRSLGSKISGGKGRPPANILTPLERQLIALQLCCWQFLYNETLQQTFRPVLSKLSKRRQI